MNSHAARSQSRPDHGENSPSQTVGCRTGQPLVNFLSDQGASAEDAYNVVQGVREMSGQNVTVEIRAQGAETRALVTETQALITETQALIIEAHAVTRAEIAVLASRVDANTARIAALDSRLDGMGWAVSATLALVMALATTRLLNWISGRRSKQRTV